MKTKADLVYSDLRLRVANKMIKFSEEPAKNYEILDEQLGTVNITKCGLRELDLEEPYSSLYLAYLLEKNDKVPFAVCPEFKIWFSYAGCQMRCRHNVGPVRANCQGRVNLCPFSKT